ncbi:anti-sigma factor [Streptacidiphilus sp. N1-3]|uniref:Anti-sigma factor n=1 Tax=Streptacidiphilus alkalitolerans TaxID=3342712 RepID=A0ABV6WVH6_9ACTN
MTTPCQESVSLGAYLLGALDPDERRAMELHVAGCEQCRAELVELAPLPGLLRHTPFEELPETAAAAESLSPLREQSLPGPAPAPVPVPELMPVPASGQVPVPAQHRRQRRRGLLTTAGLALAACVAGVAVYAAVGRDNPSAPRTAAAATWSATDPTTHVSASAAMIPEAWGTKFEVKLGGLPSGITCHMVVHAKDGRSETAGTWGSNYGPWAVIPASTSISPAEITGLDIVDGSGNMLVQLPKH